MAETVRGASHIGWIDGVRGIAAMQVALLHYAFAFLPGLGFQDPRYVHFGWELRVIGTPLEFLCDGVTAVYLFFIMSGVVLTFAFNNRPREIVPQILRRLIRLGLPLAGALVLTAILFGLLPDAHVAASRLLRQSWLAMGVPPSVPATAIGHQIVVEGLLTGYSDRSLLPGGIAGALNLEPLALARNPSLWTLHIEFVGSLLVLALVALRASLGPATHIAACLVLGAVFLASPLSMFVLGHLAAPYLGRAGGSLVRHVLAGAGLVLGVFLCTNTMISLPESAFSWVWSPPIGPNVGPRDLRIMLGAILLFASLDQMPSLRRSLEISVIRWLGKISFSLYLTHFPVLFTVTAAIYTVAASVLPFNASLAVGGIAGLTANLAIAALFEKWIDRPAINLSRRIGQPRHRAVTSATYAPADGPA